MSFTEVDSFLDSVLEQPEDPGTALGLAFFSFKLGESRDKPGKGEDMRKAKSNSSVVLHANLLFRQREWAVPYRERRPAT